MSKLSQRIRKASRVEAAPIGFGAAASRKPAATMVLLARLPLDEAKRLPEAASKGVDAVLFESGDASRLRDRLKEAGETPCGVMLAGADRQATAALKDAGIDFLALDARTTAADVLLDEQFGFVLAVSMDMSDAALRVLEGLFLDALLVPPLDGPLTLQRQLELRRLHLLSRTPMLTEVSPEIAGPQLQSLREAGVAGVIVDGKAAWNRLPALREAIDALPPRGRRREERTEAVLPRVALTPAAEEEEEEDFP